MCVSNHLGGPARDNLPALSRRDFFLRYKKQAPHWGEKHPTASLADPEATTCKSRHNLMITFGEMVHARPRLTPLAYMLRVINDPCAASYRARQAGDCRRALLPCQGSRRGQESGCG